MSETQKAAEVRHTPTRLRWALSRVNYFKARLATAREVHDSTISMLTEDVQGLVEAADCHDGLVAALKAMLVMTDRGDMPRKFDEALTWRENDEKARAMAEAAIAKAESQA